jgi:DNA invertase Pin-like site-specific DNA recombinase
MTNGKRIGYKRVSTHEQNHESQLIGIELDKIFADIETGYSTQNRHELKKLKEYVRDDDHVFVECMDRLGRNGYDLDAIVEFFLAKGVQITFVREGITLGKKNDLMSKLAYDMMKAFIHFFSQLAKERQRIGIEKAKRQGKYKGGHVKMTPYKITQLKDLMNTRKSKSQISRDLGVSRFTIYRYLKTLQSQQDKEVLK